jgi:hypothetical protein
LIQTGRKLLLSLSIIIVLHGCGLFNWDKEQDYYYRMLVWNNTNDTLTLVFNDSVINNSIYNYTIFPNDTAELENNAKGVNKEQDPIETMFTDGKHDYYLFACVFKNDSLLKKWEGPLSIMNDSTHHFFNYNSWDTWLTADNEGVVIFNIEESDIKN